MANIKLFRVTEGRVKEIPSNYSALEKKLQNLIEANLECVLGIQLLYSEFITSKDHGGRIDILGIDENNCPVIIEYKRTSNENVVNQGLFYLDWLLNHKKDFEFLVMEKFGKERVKEIDWHSTRLVCIAADFTKYDEHAVRQMERNIELIRYRYFKDLLLLELVNTVSVFSVSPTVKYDRNIKNNLNAASQSLVDLYNELKAYVFSLGDDIQFNQLKHYHAFRKLKNFLCVEVMTRSQTLCLSLSINPNNIVLEEGFTRDVSKIGHLGTGDLEITVTSTSDLDKAKALIKQSYENQ